MPSPARNGDHVCHNIYGMENFGNSCYCNSILQCLFHTKRFRLNLLSHNFVPHDPHLSVQGHHDHSFTTKYEQLLQKRLREQGKPVDNNNLNGSSATSSSGPASNTRPSIKNSLFSKFSSNSTPQLVQEDPSQFAHYKKLGYVFDAVSCDSFTTEQRMLIKKNPQLYKLKIFVTRPTSVTDSNRNDNSTSSTALLDSGNSTNGNQAITSAPPITSRSSFVVVGIPQPETNLTNPINPFNANPSAEQRKRSALINGPIINLDHPMHSLDLLRSDACLLYALKDIFEAMVENKSPIGVVSPSHFITKLKEKNFLFRQVNMHQDAHEFCNYLINEAIEAINLETGSQKNWCTDIFQGLITNETKCLSCETVTSKEETFLDLSIDIPPGDSAYSLTYALNNFSKKETLSHQNKFYCNTCLSLQEAVKTIKLKSTPDILVINFKRFKYDDKLDRMVKLFDSISYPMKLRLFNTKKSEDDDTLELKLYGLYALVVHIGGGPMHGHYVALCKGQAGLWFLFDDETIEIVDETYVLRFFGNGPGLASAYILFYEKLDTKVSDDELDFGIDLDEVYNGNDYSLALKPLPVETENGNGSKYGADSNNELHHEDFGFKEFVTEPSGSLETSISSLGRKTSKFKKTFMFESKDSKEKDKKEPQTPEATPAKEEEKFVPRDTIPENESGSSSSSFKDFSTYPSTIDNTTPAQTLLKTEKKSWINGLKRRELKAEVPQERKASQGSIRTLAGIKNGEPEAKEAITPTDTKEKRKSFFSFKRKIKN